MKITKKKAQAGLEYLMTYGWALVLIAAVVGVLVLIVGNPSQAPVFTSSNSTKFLITGGTIDSSNLVTVVLKNATGGKITVTSFSLGSPFGDISGNSTLNGVTRANISVSPLAIIAGGEMRFSNIKYAGTGAGIISIKYTDVYTFARDLNVTGKRGTATLCGNGKCDAGEDWYTCPSDCPY